VAPAMHRSGLFNPPIQGSVPATPEASITKRAFLPSGHQTNLHCLDSAKGF